MPTQLQASVARMNLSGGARASWKSVLARYTSHADAGKVLGRLFVGVQTSRPFDHVVLIVVADGRASGREAGHVSEQKERA